MNSWVTIPLAVDAAQRQRLEALQKRFAEVCNAITPVVQAHRTWHRVTLHHMAYRGLRSQFPDVGSQMICNAIYSVSRMGRRVFQNPLSPTFIGRWGDAALPLMRFLPDAPVYFDRHTLSVKSGLASLYTLDGRIKFEMDLGATLEAAFQAHSIKEIMLNRSGAQFVLQIAFTADGADLPVAAHSPSAASSDLPPHIELEQAA